MSTLTSRAVNIAQSARISILTKVHTRQALLDVLGVRRPDIVLVVGESDRATLVGMVRAIRAVHRTMPILLICPSNNLGDAEAALRAGANDFVTEFAPPAEVAARVRSLNRTPVREVRRGRARDIRLDWGTRSVRVGRASVVLAPMEFAVLECLLRHAGKAVKREVLLAEVWAPDATCTSNRPDVYMHYLRRKLSSVGLGDAIRTMRGTGYVLQLE